MWLGSAVYHDQRSLAMDFWWSNLSYYIPMPFLTTTSSVDTTGNLGDDGSVRDLNPRPRPCSQTHLTTRPPRNINNEKKTSQSFSIYQYLKIDRLFTNLIDGYSCLIYLRLALDRCTRLARSRLPLRLKQVYHMITNCSSWRKRSICNFGTATSPFRLRTQNFSRQYRIARYLRSRTMTNMKEMPR